MELGARFPDDKKMIESTPPDLDTDDQLRRKIQDGSVNSDDYRRLGGLLFLAGKLPEAVGLFRRAIDLAQTNLQKARVCIEFGWVYFEIRQLEEAKALVQQGVGYLETEADRPELFACRGALQTLTAQLEGRKDAETGRRAAAVALKTLENGLEESVEFEGKAMAYFDAASLQGELGNVDKAIALSEKCLRYPLHEWERISCLTILADALRRGEQYNKAHRTLAEAIHFAGKYKTTLANLYLHLGLVQRLSSPIANQQHLMNAQSTFQQALLALEADPYRQQKSELCSDIYLNLAAVCYELGDFKGAAATYDEAFHSVPGEHHNFCEAQLGLGQCHQAEGSYAKARSYFERVLVSSYSSKDQKLRARESIARSLYELREYGKASETLKELALAYPEDDPIKISKVLWLGYCYEGLGDHGAARETYEEVIASPCAFVDDKSSAQEGLRRLPPIKRQTTH